MPTEAKSEAIDELIELMKNCSIAISTDYSGLNVSDMSDFRTLLRENGIKFKVIKNTLFKIAAEQADWPEMKELIDGQTGIAFGYGDEQSPAKIISSYIKDSGTNIDLKILKEQYTNVKKDIKDRFEDKVEKIRGLDITVVIKSNNITHSYELLKQFNFPFIEKETN